MDKEKRRYPFSYIKSEDCKNGDYVEVTCSDVYQSKVFRSKVTLQGRNPIVVISIDINYSTRKGAQLSLGNTYWVKDIRRLTQFEYCMDKLKEQYI